MSSPVSLPSDFKFREIFGRAFHSQNDGYMLPADSAEHNRLDVQHILLRLVLGNSLYPAQDIVRKALSPHQQERPAVLDIGTGSGRWAIDMAAEFPHAEVVGLDLVPPTLAGVNEMPANCRFEVDDANLPLEHYANSFNLCHVRSAEAGIHDFDNFLYNVAQILRPHGVLVLSTGSPQLYDENFEPLPVAHPSDERFSWVQRVLGETFIVYRNRGNPSCEAGIHWHGWLEKNPNFYDLKTREVFIPLGPWTGTADETQTYIAELMRYDISHALHSFKPMILMDGLRQDVVDRMVDAAIIEMRDLKVHAYVKWRYTYAIRKDTPWCERLEAPRPIDKMSALTITPRFEDACRSLETRNSIAIPA
ncbi:hypothetical protein FRC02_009797 [Tulasnella sp. 418]|nr:hypothetical protein FRC02_009797 [Tulasnella sp. 418]